MVCFLFLILFALLFFFFSLQSDYIHYVEGFLLAPGFIDLSSLDFVTAEGSYDGVDDMDDEDSKQDSSSGGGRGRNLERDSSSFRHLTDQQDFEMEGSALDIAVFHLPEECSSSRTGCDWTELGIGARSEDGKDLRYCCTAETMSIGLCRGTQKGRLIMDAEKFQGKHRLINIPAQGEYTNHLKYGRFEEPDKSGKFIVVFANCNEEGRPVIVEGHTVWKSLHGYLPGDKFGLMYFYAVVFIVYFVILIWYGVSMKTFEDANIPIQSWIFGTICMGTLEMFFLAGDLFVWNEDGTRFWVAYYVGVVLGVLKRGVSRCLLVMVACGWGVIRDELGPIMKKINFLGGLYVVVALVHDIMTVVAYTEIQRMSQEKEEELFDIVSILALVLALIDAIFYFWIIDAMSSTMEYLDGMKQTSKLMRYLRLRCILMFSILFAVMWAVFCIVDSFDEGIVSLEAKWVIDASMEMNYLFVLVVVSWLWRPQPNAKEYAYVMELPGMNAALDDDDEGGVMELTAVVPSAMDLDDDDDMSAGEKFQDEPPTSKIYDP
jgi:hypothetical protein